MKKKHLFAMFIAACITFCLTTVMTASAVGPTTITWIQGTSPTATVQSTYANTNANITFEGIAISPSPGTFQVRLQYKNAFGSWVDDTNNNTYTISQNSNQSYNLRTGQYVTGQYFRKVWVSHGNHDYRVVLYNPSNPQVTTLQDLYLY